VGGFGAARVLLARVDVVTEFVDDLTSLGGASLAATVAPSGASPVGDAALNWQRATSSNFLPRGFVALRAG